MDLLVCHFINSPIVSLSIGELAEIVIDIRNVLPSLVDVIAFAIGVLNEAIGACRLDEPAPPGELDALRTMDSVIGVLTLERTGDAGTGDLDVDRIEALIVERNDARSRKDWSAADKARDELAAMGIEVKDGPEGTTWKKAIAVT